MTMNTLERALWEIAATPESFKRDPAAFLSRFSLADHETEELRGFKVRALIDRNANPILVMRMWTALHGRASLPEYMRLLHEVDPTQGGHPGSLEKLGKQ